MHNESGRPHRSAAGPPVFRIDIAIALCALLVSGLATAASWWQTHVIADQLSAQVWPYVTVTGEVSPDRVEIDVANDGLGPAVVKSFVLRVDGKPQHDMIAALHQLIGPLRAPRARARHTDLELSNLNPGKVLRAGNPLPFFRMAGNRTSVARFTAQAERISMQVCYCSILANCWTVSYPSGPQPKAQRECADRGSEQFHDVPLTTAGQELF